VDTVLGLTLEDGLELDEEAMAELAAVIEFTGFAPYSQIRLLEIDEEVTAWS
jgi:hypothetical protein